MATGGLHETLERYEQLAKAVLGVTERQEHLLERADALSAQYERLERQAAGRHHSREKELDSAYRRLREQVERHEAQLRWSSLAWTWNPLLWSVIGGLVGAMAHVAAGRLVGLVVGAIFGS